MSNKKLNQLYAEHTGKVSDKWSLYLTEYDRLFDDYRDKPIRLLEIGIQNGGSLEIWSKYFSNASALIGCDINPDCVHLSFDDSRIGVIVGDANAPEVREQVFQRSPQFDIIIDDGSHLSSDIIKSFALYFPLVVEGGVFIAEDLHCSYVEQFEGGLYNPYSSLAFFKRLGDIVNYEHWRNNKPRKILVKEFTTHFGVDFDDYDLARIHSIEFINSLCVIKKLPPEKNVIGKRIIAGLEERVSNWLHKLNATSIQDIAMNISDDEHLDVFELANNVNILNQTLAERDGQIASLNLAVTERDGQIANLNLAVTERDVQIRELKIVASGQDERIRALDQTLNKRELALNSSTAELGRIISSRSWKVTKPLRFAGRFLRRDWAAVRASILSFRNAKGNSFVTEEETSANKDVILKDGASNSWNKQDMLLEQPSFCNKRILLVSYYCPSRAHAGGLRILDIYSLIKSAFPNVQLDLYTPKRPVVDWNYEDVEKIFDNIFWSPSEDLSLGGFNQLPKTARRYDVIDLQFHQSAHDIKSWGKVGQKIIFTPMESLLRVLLISLRYRDIFPMRKMLRNIRLAKEELIFARKADEVVCVSEQDASPLRMFCPAGKVCALETAVSNIEFADAFARRHEDITPELKQPIILYVAYFGSETNIKALKWYLINVHPLITIALPEYRLQVVGRGDLSIFKEYQSHFIEFIGEVPKLTPYIRGAKVGIAPALSGSGIRGKINQYSIYGVPVVATKIAAKGLVYQDGLDIFITDQDRSFAKHCIRLLRENDLNRAIGQRAREKVFAQYTWESKMDAIKKIYNLEVA